DSNGGWVGKSHLRPSTRVQSSGQGEGRVHSRRVWVRVALCTGDTEKYPWKYAQKTHTLYTNTCLGLSVSHTASQKVSYSHTHTLTHTHTYTHTHTHTLTHTHSH